MNDDKPHLTGGRCGRCLQPFRITEQRTPAGGMLVTFACPVCGRETRVPFSVDDLARWRDRRRRKSGRPTVDPSRFAGMREAPIKSQWRTYRVPGERMTVESAEPDIGGGDE